MSASKLRHLRRRRSTKGPGVMVEPPVSNPAEPPTAQVASVALPAVAQDILLPPGAPGALEASLHPAQGAPRALSLSLPPRASLAQIWDAWLGDKAASTRKAYASDLWQFVEFLGGDVDTVFEQLLSDPGVASEMGGAWLVELRKRGLGAATCQRRVSVLRSFVEAARQLRRCAWSLELVVPMMTTSNPRHLQEAQEQIEADLLAFPSLVATLVELLREEAPEGKVAFVQQKRNRLNVYDAYVLLYLQQRLEHGELALRKLCVGTTPEGSSTANQAQLSVLPAPFLATVYESRGESDGELAWGPHSAPLEVGATSSSRTFLHLLHNNALARWPYDHECILVCASPELLDGLGEPVS